MCSGALREIDRGRLTGQDVVSYDLVCRDAEQDVALQRFPAGKIPLGGEWLTYYEWMPVSPDGRRAYRYPRVAAPRALAQHEGLRRLPRPAGGRSAQVDQVIELMKRGMAAGWVPPAVPIRKVLPQIEKQWVSDVTQSPLYKPFEDFPERSPRPIARGSAPRRREAIVGSVIPALKELHKFISETYLPACRQEIAASGLPGGPEYYQAQIRWLTTTDLSPAEIHEIGEREVAADPRRDGRRHQADGLLGIVPGIPEIAADRSALCPRAPRTEVLPAFRDIAKRVDPELPKLFAELPRTPYGIREIPAYRGETAAHYTPGASDGSRAGYFNANTLKGSTKPRHEMEALFLHEAVPGHHLQVARAQELKGCPNFRRNGLYNAYVEGWALYAESLGEDLGLYKDPYSKFGRLNGEIHRACRLVVDTGMHAWAGPASRPSRT